METGYKLGLLIFICIFGIGWILSYLFTKNTNDYILCIVLSGVIGLMAAAIICAHKTK